MASNTQRLIRIGQLSVALARHKLSGNRRQFSQVLFEAMFELGGVYVKFLQALLVRSDLFTDQTIAQQIRVYENVTHEYIDIKALLNCELGARWHDQITHLNQEPFAAGSFGQVYRARLRNNRDVIIKVLRPSLTKTLRFDLRLLGFITHFITLFYPDSTVNLNEIFRDFKDVTVSEINYRREAAFALELYERYENHHAIVIPYTHINLSTKTLLVQDYIGGISVAEVFQQSSDPRQYIHNLLGSDLNYQLQEMGFEFLRSIFIHPTTLGDPHPGNIKLLPGNKVGLIDFGMISEAPNDRAGFFKLVTEYQKIYNGKIDVKSFSIALLGMFSGKLVSSIETLGEVSRNSYKARSLLNELAQSAEGVYESKRGPELESLLEKGKFLIAFYKIINENNRFGLRFQFDATTFLRSSHMFVNVVNSLGCRQEVLPNVYNRVVDDIRTNHPEALHSGSKRIHREQAGEIVSDWLDRVAKTDPILFHRIQSHLGGRLYV